MGKDAVVKDASTIPSKVVSAKSTEQKFLAKGAATRDAINKPRREGSVVSMVQK